MLFIIGALATSLPLLLGLILARYVFKFHPALSLGCTAGARTTTAALGAIQEAVGSETPSLGYTVTYAVGKYTTHHLGSNHCIINQLKKTKLIHYGIFK